ncbi:MAG: M48 family metallopeptidase [Syntrophobacteraceae bacterium]
MIESNWFLFFFLSIFAGQRAFTIWLEHVNSNHSRRHLQRVPAGFTDFIDDSKMVKINEYNRERSRWGTIEAVVSDGVLLVLILSGFLPMVVAVSTYLGLSLIPAGLLFFLAPGLVQYLVELPFSYYHTFVLEEKFGFNKSTVRLWGLDLIKSGILSITLFALLFSILVLLIVHSPRYWWFWGFLIVAGVQFLLAVLYPVVIAPLFNKFEPVRDEALARKISELMADNGIRVKRILQMNAGLRSRHTNAYFTGIGKLKQIVLYDTLIESHTHDEILSVLAHEAGHYRKRHVLKQLALFGSLSLSAFYATWLFVQWPLPYQAFGFDAPLPYVGLFLAGILWQKIGFFLQPFYMSVSRRFEREADVFAVKMLRTAAPLVEAMKRLSADNLSNLNPHPLYVWFHYSHPPIVERVAGLEEAGKRFSNREAATRERLVG